MSDDVQQTVSRSGKTVWNHHPKVPIETAPYFSWPPQPRRLARNVSCEMKTRRAKSLAERADICQRRTLDAAEQKTIHVDIKPQL